VRHNELDRRELLPEHGLGWPTGWRRRSATIGAWLARDYLRRLLRRSLPMIEKRLLIPDRVRRPPREGFSWIDRRFLRDYAPKLTADALMLYFFLAAVSDRQGLSFYSDATIAVRLRMREATVVAAREQLVIQDLVAYHAPLTQVLSLPQGRIQRGGGLQTLGELFRSLQPDARSEP
jgi:hypothetical protein